MILRDATMGQDPAGNGTDRAIRRTQAGPPGFARPGGPGRPQLTLAGPESPPPPPAGPPRRRRGLSSLAWLAVVPAGLIAVAVIVHANQAVRATPAARPALVVASVPYWQISQGTTAVLAHRRDVTEFSPWMYGLNGDGQIVLDAGNKRSAITADLSRLRAQGLPIVPTLANVDARGDWSYGPVARMLHDPALAARQVAQIVALAGAHDYAGIDLDYEDLQAGDRQAFTAFVTRLASALHARGKVLSVALFAKTTNAGYAPRNVAQDYAAIGRVADQVRLMTYDYHWPTSAPGPVAPIGWVRDVIRYAETQMPASKIVLGIPQYGYNWTDHHGVAITWQQAVQLSRRYHAQPRYSAASQAPWFTYTDAAGREHTVWYENAASSRAKLEAAHAAGLGGVYLWMYGTGDPGTWPALRQVFPVGARTAPSPRRGAS